MSSIENLLTPSLSGSQPARPAYSVGSHVIVAFVGGPAGLLLFSFYSIRHARQLDRFKWWYLIFLLLVIGSQLWIGWVAHYGLPNWFPMADGSLNIVKVSNRVISLLLMGVTYLIQRQLFSISELKGDAPSPWVPGIVTVLVGWLITFLSVTGVSSYVQ